MKTCSRSIPWVVVFGTLAGSGPASAQTASGQPAAGANEQVPIVRLMLQPAPLPTPALKRPLLPPFLETTSGNAAPLYYRAFLLFREPGLAETRNKVYEWANVPLKDLPVKEARQHLAKAGSVLREIDTAARRERCTWDLPIRGNRNVFELLLHDAQEGRFVAALLAVQARVQIFDGKYDDAVHTLQTGYALARHINEMSLLITGLVGIAGGEIMSSRVQEMAELPGSPNLYWSLTALPHPLIDLRPSVETEMGMLPQSFPFLQNPETASRSAAEWQSLLEDGLAKAEGDLPAWKRRLAVSALALKNYPAAKERLIEKGRTTEQVDRMPVAQVLAIQAADTFEAASQDISKWFNLPYWQGWEGMQQAELSLGAKARGDDFARFTLQFLPSPDSCALAMHRLDRRIAELRVIEALRHYAATHERKLPARLDEITEVPIPIDPITGQPFEYHLDGQTAILELRAPGGRLAVREGERVFPRIAASLLKRYELTIAK